MEDTEQLAYLRVSMQEYRFDKKMHANPARCRTLNRSDHSGGGKYSYMVGTITTGDLAGAVGSPVGSG